MKTTMRFSVAALPALLAACSTSPAPAPQPGGDFAPHATFQAPPRAVTRGLAQVSTPQSPRESFTPRIDVPPVIEQDAVLVIPAGAPGTYVLSVDAVAADSYLYLLVPAQTQDEMDAALADIVVTSPTGAVINEPSTLAPAHPGETTPEAKPLPSVHLLGMPAGDYTIQVGATAAKYGLTVKAQQPTSQVTLTMKPSTAELLFGNDASIDVTVMDGDRPVSSANVLGYLVDPDIHRTIAVTFVPLGKGLYRATGLGAAFAQGSAAGVWHVFAEADGKTSSGQAFTRFASTGFDFVVPTAQILDASTTRVVKDASGQTTGFEVDVSIESKATDRYEVSALLTTVGGDGQEHPLVRAETADVLDPGTSTLTLHFDAGFARLTGLEGDYLVRDVMLYSQGVNAPMQRTLAGNGQRFPSVRIADLAPAAELPPRVLEMQRTGLL
jgi:hypothetical protein